MKTLYLDCSMGAAGDMLMSALLELTSDKAEYIKKLNAIGVPKVKYIIEDSVKCGICGTHVRVLVDGKEEEDTDAGGSEHHGENHHHHHHSKMAEIGQIVSGLTLSDNVKKEVLAVYEIVAEAESKVHGKPVSEVHFHEVGAMDAIADIAGCAFLIQELGIEQIIASPVTVGFGQTKCAHGILPVPAPATANILMGVPTAAGNIRGELCTPTGAALLKYYAAAYSFMPPMVTERIGYGMGRKDFEAANCVRAIVGETETVSDEVVELSCNLDDMTGEETGYAQEVLLAAGALDVYTTAIGMKKSRPGILLSVMCRKEDREKMTGLLFCHTTTIGVREYHCSRMILGRKERQIRSALGDVRVKETSGFGVSKSKMEYEDLKAIADKEGLSIREVKKLICDEEMGRK